MLLSMALILFAPDALPHGRASASYPPATAGGTDLPSVALGHRRRGDDAEAPLLPPRRPCGSRVGQGGRTLLAQKVSFSPSCMLRAGPAAVSVPKDALRRL